MRTYQLINHVTVPSVEHELHEHQCMIMLLIMGFITFF